LLSEQLVALGRHRTAGHVARGVDSRSLLRDEIAPEPA
jgi:hypothetical protein